MKLSFWICFPLVFFCFYSPTIYGLDSLRLFETFGKCGVLIKDDAGPKGVQRFPRFVLRKLSLISPSIQRKYIGKLLQETRKLLPVEVLILLPYISNSEDPFLLAHPKEFKLFGSAREKQRQAKLRKKLKNTLSNLREARSLLSYYRSEDLYDLIRVNLFIGLITSFDSSLSKFLVGEESRFDEAAEAFGKALVLSSDLEPNLVSLLKYFLGKNYFEAALYYAHHDGISSAPGRHFFHYERLSLKYLLEVIDETDIEERVHYEAQYLKLKIESLHGKLMKDKPSLELSDTRRRLIDILKGLVNHSSKEEIELDLKSDFGLIVKLVKDLRWTYDNDHTEEAWQHLYALERAIGQGSSGYETLIHHLLASKLFIKSSENGKETIRSTYGKTSINSILEAFQWITPPEKRVDF